MKADTKVSFCTNTEGTLDNSHFAFHIRDDSLSDQNKEAKILTIAAILKYLFTFNEVFFLKPPDICIILDLSNYSSLQMVELERMDSLFNELWNRFKDKRKINS